MKHRTSKLKLEHSLIPGLRELLESMKGWAEIQRIVPGRIKRRAGSGSLRLKVQYLLPTGLKCLAASGGAVQEVFIVSSNPTGLGERIKDQVASRR